MILILYACHVLLVFFAMPSGITGCPVSPLHVILGSVPPSLRATPSRLASRLFVPCAIELARCSCSMRRCCPMCVAGRHRVLVRNPCLRVGWARRGGGTRTTACVMVARTRCGSYGSSPCASWAAASGGDSSWLSAASTRVRFPLAFSRTLAPRTNRVNGPVRTGSPWHC